MFVLDDGTLVHSAADLTAAATCEYAVLRALDRRLGLGGTAVAGHDPMLVRLTVLGARHERTVLRAFEDQFGTWSSGAGAGVRTLVRPGIDSYDVRSALEEMDAETGSALSEGADVLYQPGFFDGAFVGWADFLVRETTQTEPVWSVRDTKLARSEKVTALLQLAAYAHQLARMDIRAADEVHLVLGTGMTSTWRVDDLVPVLRSRQQRLIRLLERHRENGVAVVWGAADVRACNGCSECQQELEARRDPLLIAGATLSQRVRLLDAGLTTMEQVGATTSPVAGLTNTTWNRLRSQAALQARQDAGDGHVLHEIIDTRAITALPDAAAGDIFGKVVCPLRAFTMQLPDSDLLPEVTPPRPALQVADGICFRQSITVYEDVSPKTRQRLQWQSEKWALLYNKRPSVERGYASMKSGATEDVGRGWIQLRGIVKVSFMLAVAVMSQNLRLALGEIAVNGPDEGPEADVILRGPEEFFGHEELNVYGDIERYDTPHNSDH
jgi:hypothetical protein